MSTATVFSKMVREDRFGFSPAAIEYFDSEIVKLSKHHNMDLSPSLESCERFKKEAKELIRKCSAI